MTTQDPDELLKKKQELIQQKQEFANFARSVVEQGEVQAGQQFENDRQDDDQNRMKSVENRMI